MLFNYTLKAVRSAGTASGLVPTAHVFFYRPWCHRLLGELLEDVVEGRIVCVQP